MSQLTADPSQGGHRPVVGVTSASFLPTHYHAATALSDNRGQ